MEKKVREKARTSEKARTTWWSKSDRTTLAKALQRKRVRAKGIEKIRKKNTRKKRKDRES